MLLRILLAGLALVAIACTAPTSQSSPPPTTMQSNAIQSTAVQPALIQTATLIAQQEQLPPLGTQPEANRPIGFASIFLTLENPSDRPQTLELLKVEVIAVENDSIQLSTDQAQTHRLMPLENAVLDIQLNNQSGYQTRGAVKAIATYRIGNQTHRIESLAVEIR